MQIETKPTNEVAVGLAARETDWEYAPGRRVDGNTFNGQVPGPTIEAEVGDTLVGELTNELPEPTTIHWHGLRVPADMDGTEAVQRAVEPGESFEYRFVVPDAGTFWYHSHVNETEQLERGLYGALIVRGPDEPVLDGERVLHLDDLKLDEEGRLAPFGDPHEHHAGRVQASETLITPGERVDLAVGPFAEGELLEIEALPYDRGKGETPRERFATLRVGQAAPSRAAIPDTLR